MTPEDRPSTRNPLQNLRQVCQNWLARLSKRRVIFYGDFIDPFCYIGFTNLIRACEERGVEMEWRGFEMNPETPEAGYDLHAGTNSDLQTGMWASVQSFAKNSGVSLVQPRRVPSTWKAHAVVEIAPNFAVKKLLIERIYQAYFQSRLEIGRWDVLEMIIRDSALRDLKAPNRDASAVRSRLEKNRSEALRHRFLGMPAFRFQNQSFFGARSKEDWIQTFQTGTR